jgi:hypothetical protein
LCLLEAAAARRRVPVGNASTHAACMHRLSSVMDGYAVIAAAVMAAGATIYAPPLCSPVYDLLKSSKRRRRGSAVCRQFIDQNAKALQVSAAGKSRRRPILDE